MKERPLSLVDVLMVNDSEARQLSGDYSLRRDIQFIAVILAEDSRAINVDLITIFSLAN